MISFFIGLHAFNNSILLGPLAICIWRSLADAQCMCYLFLYVGQTSGTNYISYFLQHKYLIWLDFS